MLKDRTKINMQLILLCILLLLGNAIWSNALILAFAYTIFIILRNNSEKNYKVLFLLLPNIRILDKIGINNAVNILYLLISVKYLAEHRKNNIKIYIASIFFFIWEMMHVIYYSDINIFLFTVCNITFDLFVALSLFENSVIEFKTGVSYLSYGCFMSAVIYLLSNTNTITRLVTTTYRFQGYGNDPNYYSIYILISIAGILICLRNTDKIIWHIIKIFSLAFLGLLTASKMYVFCLLGLIAVYIILMLIQKDRLNFKVLGGGIFIVTLLVLIFHGYVAFFVNKFMDRFNENFFATAIGNFTTGRADNIINYINILSRDWAGLFLGKGVLYHQYYRAHGFNYILAAHNTYFDILLSEGLIGSTFIIIGYLVIIKNRLVPFRECSKLNYLPIIVFLVVALGLSCYISDMFWYLLVLVLMPLRKCLETNAE